VPDVNDRPRTLGTKQEENPSLGEVIDYIRAYAEQETVGPLKGVGRWVGYGAAAAFTMGLGLVLVLFGLLRALQYEFDRLSTGSLSWLAYVVTLVVTILLLVFTLLRVKKSTLHKEPQ
jgi:cytochrome c biogenesis protein CcdA